MMVLLNVKGAGFPLEVRADGVGFRLLSWSGHSRYGPVAFARGRQMAANLCHSFGQAAPGAAAGPRWGCLKKRACRHPERLASPGVTGGR